MFDKSPENLEEFQVRIPGGLSTSRYISGHAALNLPAPEDTSGDWHFFAYFFRYEPGDVAHIAGEGETVNTNHIYGDYGIYDCTNALRTRGLVHEGGGTPYAANHFRAILDLLYEGLIHDKYPRHVQFASEDFLDTSEEKDFLLEKATSMMPFLTENRQALLQQWLEKEKLPGYRA
jgi:hypothetical protein